MNLNIFCQNPIPRRISMPTIHRFFARAAVALALGLGVPARVHAGGIPEPSLVLYGTIRNSADNRVRLTDGFLTWQFQKSGGVGGVVSVTAALTNVGDQFSYVLQVPCETIVSGSSLSTNVLGLTPTSATF